jgi:hypothetical protein
LTAVPRIEPFMPPDASRGRENPAWTALECQTFEWRDTDTAVTRSRPARLEA